MLRGTLKGISFLALCIPCSTVPADSAADEIAVQIDPAFGGMKTDGAPAGVVSVSLGYGNDRATDLAIDGDGRIFLVGHISNGQSTDVVVQSFSKDGVLDEDFGESDEDGTPRGVARFSLGAGNDVADAVALQADGKVVIAGHYDADAATGLFVLRTNADGTSDPSFGLADDAGIDGMVTVSLGKGDHYARDIAVTPDGGIVVVGDRRTELGQSRIFVTRITPDGRIDTGFGPLRDGSGRGGVTSFGGQGVQTAQQMLLQTDGKILVAGQHLAHGGTADILIARYDAEGLLDEGFGGKAGFVVMAMSGGDDLVRDIALQDDGKIVLLVDSMSKTGSIGGVAIRLFADGTLDKTFEDPQLGAGDGSRIAFSGARMAFGAGIARLEGDEVVLVGTHRDGRGSRLVVSRFPADGLRDQTSREAATAAASQVEVTAAGSFTARAVAVQGDDLIIAGDASASPGGATNMALVRLTSW